MGREFTRDIKEVNNEEGIRSEGQPTRAFFPLLLQYTCVFFPTNPRTHTSPSSTPTCCPLCLRRRHRASHRWGQSESESDTLMISAFRLVPPSLPPPPDIVGDGDAAAASKSSGPGHESDSTTRSTFACACRYLNRPTLPRCSSLRGRAGKDGHFSTGVFRPTAHGDRDIATVSHACSPCSNSDSA